MRHIFCIFLLLISFSLPAQIFLGGKVGLNIATLSGGRRLGAIVKPGPVAGLIGNAQLTDQLSIEAGLLYAQMGGGFLVYVDSAGKSYETGAEITTQYIQIPLLLKITTSKPEANAKFYFSAGGYFAIMLSGKYQYHSEDRTETYPFLFDFYDRNGIKGRHHELGLNFGAGVMVGVGKGDLLIGARYLLALTPFYDFDPVSPDIPSESVYDANRGFRITLGYMLPVTDKG